MLAAYILRPHVDGAIEAHVGTRGGGGNAVLPSTGLSDDALLPHACTEQRLANGVVDFMSAGVGEVLALEPDGGSVFARELRRVLCQALRAVQRGGPANEGVQEIA